MDKVDFGKITKTEFREKLLKLKELPAIDSYYRKKINEDSITFCNYHEDKIYPWLEIGDRTWEYIAGHYNYYRERYMDLHNELIKLKKLKKLTNYLGVFNEVVITETHVKFSGLSYKKEWEELSYEEWLHLESHVKIINGELNG